MRSTERALPFEWRAKLPTQDPPLNRDNGMLRVLRVANANDAIVAIARNIFYKADRIRVANLARARREKGGKSRENYKGKCPKKP